MIDKSSVAKRLLIDSIIPVLCSVFLGLIFAQDLVFNRHYPAFQFLWSSVVAIVFYNLLNLMKKREAFAGLVVLFFLTLLTTGSYSAQYIIRDIFYIVAIASSVYLYFSLFRQSQTLHYAYAPFLFAGIYGTLYIIASEIHIAIIRGLSLGDTGGNFFSLAEISAFYGVLIGFAIGVGVSITNKIHSQEKVN
jgi:hypothetical protein